ncbi:MAG: GTP cyclohydrolase I FolE, partial [Actinobacteria bacterium]
LVAGSNVGRERNLPEAIRRLRRHADVDVKGVSRVYGSPSLGGPADAPDFYNAAIVVCTQLTPQELRAELRRIEEAMGRVRTADRNAPREIDLDIAYYGDRVADYGDWAIPDPATTTAAHVAIPIADVAPDWVHPETGLTTKKIAIGFEGNEEVRPIMAIQLSTPYGMLGPADFDDVGEVYAPRLEALVRDQLIELGEDPEREGLLRTPLRVAKALDYLTSGYSTSLDEVVNGAIFDAEGADEMVLVKGIEFYSMCEHHMLPFFGTAAVAYLPKGRIVGLSKVARIVDVYARRLQVQERLTNQVADGIIEILEPHGVAVVIEGKHLCMMMRGVQKQDTVMITSAMRGSFRSDARTRNEFLDLIKR